MKLARDIYPNKVFHLAKSWGINKKTLQMSQKISFLVQFQSFHNTSKKTVAYLMHHFACHHWSKNHPKAA